MNRSVYRRIAKKHGVSVADVKRDIQEAICAAYRNPERNLIHIKAQNAVPHTGDIPTPNEMICCVAKEVRKKKEKCERDESGINEKMH